MDNAFKGTTVPPKAEKMSAVLGAAKPLWDRLLSELTGELALTREWGSSSPKLGWSLRLKRGDRIIVYLAPHHGGFQASFALGQKAIQSAIASGLPAQVVRTIREARKYAEGTAVRLEVKAASDVDVVKTLARAKLDH